MRMSAVAELNHAKRAHAKAIEQFKEALMRAAQQNYKLKQEVTGGMQVLYYLASQCPDRTLTIRAADLITVAGSLQRKHDIATDVYHFIAVEPSPEEIAELQKHVEATNEAHDVPPVALGEAEPTDDAPSVILGE